MTGRLANLSAPPSTSRLSLTRWTAHDAAALFGLLQDHRDFLRPWIPFLKRAPRTLDETRAMLARWGEHHRTGRAARYAIRGPDGIVGEVMLIARGADCELGYWLAEPQTGRGYATEACRGLVRHAFDVAGVPAIQIHCEAANHASNEVARRLGADVAAIETVPAVLDEAPVPLRIWVLRPKS